MTWSDLLHWAAVSWSTRRHTPVAEEESSCCSSEIRNSKNQVYAAVQVEELGRVKNVVQKSVCSY